MSTLTKTFGIALLAAFAGIALTADVFAQSGARGFGTTQAENLIRSNSAERFSAQTVQRSLMQRSTLAVGVPGVNQRNFLGSTATPASLRTKPFSAVTRGPAVSPYLALSAPRASASDYYNIIRPQQQQRRENERQQIRTLQQQRRLNQLAARAPYSTTGDENQAPTGHVAVFQSLGSFQNTGNYFPPPSPPKQR